MKVFISWSGPLSHKVGEAFRTWLPGALQLVKPYFTPSDIEKGARWNAEISTELESSSVGIFCMTRENLNSSWILFEAGTLSKHIEKSRVCPVLIGLEPSERPGPLRQFQATPFQRNEIHKLMQTINAALGDSHLDDKTLDSVFDMWWPKLEEQVGEIVANHVKEGEGPVRTDHDMLLEILELTRLTSRRAASPASLPPMALSELLAGYVAAHDALQSSKSEDAMAQLETMKRAVMYMAHRARSTPPELAKLVKAVDHLSFDIGEEDDEIPF
jgi:hypothetical protein